VPYRSDWRAGGLCRERRQLAEEKNRSTRSPVHGLKSRGPADQQEAVERVFAPLRREPHACGRSGGTNWGGSARIARQTRPSEHHDPFTVTPNERCSWISASASPGRCESIEESQHEDRDDKNSVSQGRNRNRPRRRENAQSGSPSVPRQHPNYLAFMPSQGRSRKRRMGCAFITDEGRCVKSKKF